MGRESKLGARNQVTTIITTTHFLLFIFLFMLATLLQYQVGFELWLLNIHPLNIITRELSCSSFLSLLVVTLSLFFLVRRRWGSISRPVYMIGFTCYRPPDSWRSPFPHTSEHSRLSGLYNKESLVFQDMITDRSGLGQETYLPYCMRYLPPRSSLAGARFEAEHAMFSSLDSLFKKLAWINPSKDVGILVVNCSLFNPSPSLASMIVNKYKMRGNTRCYNLGGMGCSASMIATDLARQLLQVHANTCAIVVSTENMTQDRYYGNDKSMLVTNCLFRLGGAAILLSNKRVDKRRAKYELLHAVRTDKGADDQAYYCVYQRQDEVGKRGVSLSKTLMVVAGEALKSNISTLGPLVLPLTEQLLFLACLFAKRVLKMKVKSYMPDFKLAFKHFCIHAGGRGVIDELEKHLSLSPSHVEASRMTLHRFGNTSSSSVWYELAYLEGKGCVQKGDRVWQIAFGSGFMCNSIVWQALCTPKLQNDNPWVHCLHRYPVCLENAQNLK